MTDAPAASVQFVSAGTPQTGLWCPRCLLPTRVRVPIYLTTENGSSPLTVHDACKECDSGRCQ